MNILQRLTSETPVFWKRIQYACVFLIAGLGWMAPHIHMDDTLKGILIGALVGIGGMAQLAVIDQKLINNVLRDPLGSLPELLDALPTLLGQVQQIHESVMKPVTVTLNEAEDAIKTIQTPSTTTVLVEDKSAQVQTESGNGLASQIMPVGGIIDLGKTDYYE